VKRRTVRAFTEQVYGILYIHTIVSATYRRALRSARTTVAAKVRPFRSSPSRAGNLEQGSQQAPGTSSTACAHPGLGISCEFPYACHLTRRVIQRPSDPSRSPVQTQHAPSTESTRSSTCTKVRHCRIVNITRPSRWIAEGQEETDERSTLEEKEMPPRSGNRRLREAL